LPAPATLIPVGNVPVIGERGVQIIMRRKAWKGSRSGMTPELVGSTRPALRSERLMFRAVRAARPGGVGLEQWSNPSSVPLGSVVTDEEGRFRLPPLRISPKGPFVIVARSTQVGRIARDWNCGPGFWTE
jgi:hypothetical protein